MGGAPLKGRDDTQMAGTIPTNNKVVTRRQESRSATSRASVPATLAIMLASMTMP